jgi:uncharacterized protein (TIGR03083 family)
MTPDAFLTALESDGERIAEIGDRDLDAAVPSCPGWTVRDAVVHTTSVYTHKIATMRLGRRPEQGEWATAPPDGVDVCDWYHATLHELVMELQRRGPEAPSWTWYEPDQTVGFWMRRIAQETAVHRVDVESAYDAVTPVDHDLAVDGIDEVLRRFLELDAEAAGVAGSGTVGIRVGDRWWRVLLLPDATRVEEGPGPSDGEVCGDASELYLWLWGRRPDEAVTIEGDGEVVRALRERLAGATQ